MFLGYEFQLGKQMVNKNFIGQNAHFTDKDIEKSKPSSGSESFPAVSSSLSDDDSWIALFLVGFL